MLGAMLGPEKGIEAMLWTFVLGGCMALIVLIWRVGPWRLAGPRLSADRLDLAAGPLESADAEAERAQLQPPLVPGARAPGRGGHRAVCLGELL